jgi:hypothetical protein
MPVIMMELRLLARGRGSVARRTLVKYFFPEVSGINWYFPPGERPLVAYDVQVRRITPPRGKWETVSTVHPCP